MSSPAGFAARPPSEIEWEELLVRYEIGPRALRFAVDDAVRGAAGTDLGLGPVLFTVVHNEYWTGVLFEAMRTGQPVDYASVPEFDGIPGDPLYLADWLADRRAGNFATVQRRGLEVWDWRTAWDPFGPVTAYQVIQYAVALDGETLAAIRGAPKDAKV